MAKYKIITRYRKSVEDLGALNDARSIERRKIREKYGDVGKIKQTVVRSGDPDGLGDLETDSPAAIALVSEFEVNDD